MFQNYLSSIEGISIYPVISFIAFFSFFILMAAWVLTAQKDFIKTMSSLPLNDVTVKNDASSQEPKNPNI